MTSRPAGVRRTPKDPRSKIVTREADLLGRHGRGAGRQAAGGRPVPLARRCSDGVMRLSAAAAAGLARRAGLAAGARAAPDTVPADGELSKEPAAGAKDQSQAAGVVIHCAGERASRMPCPTIPACSRRCCWPSALESERLRQIIREFQRHRFGRRAESLPEDQLQLGLEEAEQVEAAPGQAATEQKSPSRAQSARCPAPDQPRRAAGPPAAGRDGGRCRRAPICPCCARPAAPHRRGRRPSASTSCRPSSGCWSCAGPKYACRACEDVVVQAPAPARLIEGGTGGRGDGRSGNRTEITSVERVLGPPIHQEQLAVGERRQPCQPGNVRPRRSRSSAWPVITPLIVIVRPVRQTS